MRKVADFLVSKRYLVLAIMLVLTVACGVAALRVGTNADMTKYLPDDSPMKQGVDIMAEHFPAAEQAKTIRVMAEGLDEAGREALKAELSALSNVDSVAHENSSDYISGEYSLYVLSTEFDYGSPEQQALLDTLETDFNVEVMTDETVAQVLPTSLSIAAVVIAMVILVVMSESWFEPLLFLGAILCAVLINMGTNIVLGEVSTITASIAAILQMVLSMDYSIILINRYRQEKALGLGNLDAMKTALRLSFGSIASSSLTTVAGLLALVFMNFKIGFDIGVVLAKGVFISMLTTLAILPSLILMADKLIFKTAKKALHIPMGGVAKFSHKLRGVLVGVFVVAFVGFYFWQQSTGICFTVEQVDPIADVFAKDNQLVLVYKNDDEPRAAALADSLAVDPYVRSVAAYPTTLGKELTSAELADAVGSLDAGMALDSSLIDLIYYDRFDGEVGKLTLPELLDFVQNDLAGDPLLGDYVDAETLASLDEFALFADADALNEPRSADELASLLGMDAEQVENLLVLYYTERGESVESGKLTIKRFVEFVCDELAADPTYADMFDAATLASLDTLRNFADPARFNAPLTSREAASALGLDEETARLLYAFAYANDPSYAPNAMTIGEFANFLTVMADDPLLSGYVDPDQAAQAAQLSAFADKTVIESQLTGAELANLLGMDEPTVKLVYALRQVPELTDSHLMTLPEFAAFLNDEILALPTFAASFDEARAAQVAQLATLSKLAAERTELGSAELAATFGVEQSAVEQLMQYKSMQDGEQVSALTLGEFIDLSLELDPEGENAAELSQLKMLVQLCEMDFALDAPTMATAFSIEPSMTELIFRLYFGRNTDGMTLSPLEAVDFITATFAADPTLSAQLPPESTAQLALLRELMNAAMGDEQLEPADLSALLGMAESDARMIATLRDASLPTGDAWTMSLKNVVAAVVANAETFGVDASQLTTAQSLMSAAEAGAAFTPEELAAIVGMPADSLEQLFLLYASRHGDTASWTISIAELLTFLENSVLTNPEYAAMLPSDAAELLGGAGAIVDATLADTAFSPSELAALVEPLVDSSSFDAGTLELLYLYRASRSADPTWEMTISDFLGYVDGEIAADERFAPFIDDSMRAQIADAKAQLDDGAAQLKGAEWSRMIITTRLPEESDETSDFVSRIHSECESWSGYHLVGTSAMNHELEESFGDELTLITLLSALAIFVIVLLTFRNIFIPIILVLLVQCGVYITITVVGLQGYDIHYMALLIVECILMGATIDYAILFTSYYREHRRTSGILDALKAAYRGSIHTISTSGLIIVLVTAIIGYTYSDPTIAQICRTLSIGVFAAIMLILFVLPGMLSAFDKLVTKKRERAENLEKSE